MRGTRGYSNVITDFCVDYLAVGRVEADGALGDEEGLVMHLMPVGWGAGSASWDGEFGAAEAVI